LAQLREFKTTDQEGRAALCAIVGASTSWRERHRRLHLHSAHEGSSDVDETLRYWCQVASGGDQATFESRLRRDNLDLMARGFRFILNGLESQRHCRRPSARKKTATTWARVPSPG
jgi:hypothetical protein